MITRGQKSSKVTDVKRIFELYDGGLRDVESSLRELFESNVFLIPLIGRYLIESGGKRLRPLFLLVSAELCGYRGKEHIPLAATLESIHTASLLHDDVVDGADLRRGKTTAHGLWGNHVVILVGDFLYSNALKRSVAPGDIRIVDAISCATTAMTEGELLQLQKSGDINITEEEYIQIISSKTGVLISAACRLGAILGGRGERPESALARFGLKAGIAFQMADDLLDYKAVQGQRDSSFGKKLGKDLEEGKITLPLIYLLREASPVERGDVQGIVEHAEGPSEKGLSRILELFEKYNVLEKALGRAELLV
jgi:octaprenyl-diphosphate synthase